MARRRDSRTPSFRRGEGTRSPPGLGVGAPAAGDGLSAGDAAARLAQRSRRSGAASSRSIGEILRANVLTRFNALLGGLLVVVAVVGPPQDGLFGVVLVTNALIGIGQELRAKRALDRLALLNAPVVHVRREGTTSDRSIDEVVVGDLVELRRGDQVAVDVRLERCVALEVDESLLTGEAVPVGKGEGDEVLSGSVVVAGSASGRVIRAGDDAFAQRLQVAARQFTGAYSELQRAANRILEVISWVVVPVAALLVTSQLLRSAMPWREALRGSVAGIGAMVPEGLVLLTTLAFAAGALRLARRRVLVQTLPAIEGLARVDVLCIDKTGTLTAPGVTLEAVESFGCALDEPLGALAAVDSAPNATALALGGRFPPPEDWRAASVAPFSSARKWSGATFTDHGSWLLGAPDVLFAGGGDERIAAALARPALAGRRVLAVGRSPSPIDGSTIPEDLVAAGIVVLAERLRPDAAATVRYLLDQGVTIKVLSGDDPATVAATARRVGIPVVGEPCDARSLPGPGRDLAEIVDGATVFGRVLPDQKRDVVAALQGEGHVVAMTGDGVNDVPALKRADVGLAMGSGSQASRAVAGIVLLDSEFAVVPALLGEGRRVIGNIERVANLFVTKTVYAALLAVVVGALALPYPFYPRQLTVVSSLTIGIPAFVLALAPGAPRARPHFLRRILAFTVPSGVAVGTATLAVYALGRGPLGASVERAKEGASVVLFVLALFVLVLLARPWRPWRVALVVAMACCGVLAALLPLARRVFALALPPRSLLVTALAAAVPTAAVLFLVLRRTSRHLLGGARAREGAAGYSGQSDGRASPSS